MYPCSLHSGDHATSSVRHSLARAALQLYRPGWQRASTLRRCCEQDTLSRSPMDEFVASTVAGECGPFNFKVNCSCDSPLIPVSSALRLALALILALSGTLATRARRSHFRRQLEKPSSPPALQKLRLGVSSCGTHNRRNFEHLALKCRAKPGNKLGQLAQGRALRATVDASRRRRGSLDH